MARRALLAVLLPALCILKLIGSSPLWGQEGDGIPLAIGFVAQNGDTAVEYFTDTIPGEGDTASGLAYESAPPGHEVVHLTNLERVSNGVPPLKAAWALTDSAQFHSDWMADHDCFAHNCPSEPEWVTRIESAGYLNWLGLGENIAAGYGTAETAVDGWMGSPSHRASMLNPAFREGGGGYAFSGTSTYYHYWTLDLGERNNGQGYPVYPVIINNEAWSTTSPQVQLYVHGSGWANQMRFRNQNGTWSEWEPFSASKSWTLSCDSGSPVTVYARITDGLAVLQTSDQIHVDIPLSTQPSPLVFFSEQGTTPTIPASYQLQITCCDSWSATANRTWIQLSGDSGTGSGEATVSLEGFPTNPGTHTGTITVQTQTSQEQVNVPVTLVVTDGPLQKSHVPSVAKNQS